MLYQIQKSDIKKAAHVLGQSLMDYPVFKYILPEDQGRTARIDHLFNFLVRYGMLNGEVIAPSNKLEGISIWIPSKRSRPSVTAALRAGYFSLAMRISLKSMNRLNEIGSKKRDMRSAIVQDPYCLMDVIGVRPQYKGKGFARRMMEYKFGELDKQKIPCYLETSSRENLTFYEKFGFDLIHQYELVAMKVFCLYRKPKA